MLQEYLDGVDRISFMYPRFGIALISLESFDFHLAMKCLQNSSCVIFACIFCMFVSIFQIFLMKFVFAAALLCGI